MDCIHEFSLPSTPACQIQKQPMNNEPVMGVVMQEEGDRGLPMDCIQEFSLPSIPASQIQEQPMRLSSHMVMYMSMSMKMWPTDKPLKILRLYCPVNTIVSMDCMHTITG